MQQFFRRLAQATAQAVGTPWTFLAAMAVVVLWAASGPAFHYSDTWQLVINTGTTIVTFLMVFLIQNTQNRDAKVMHLKLDELIRATHTARNKLVDMEAMSDEELATLQQEFKELHRRASETLDERRQHDRRITPPASPGASAIPVPATASTSTEAATSIAGAAAGPSNGQG
ncbi:MAG TPA: low affinity iron permease family protein [Gemmatimonadaceae bacterium]|nr:low affinity iron permease family protein [Gemmatimonadaceae bacterium]